MSETLLFGDNRKAIQTQIGPASVDLVFTDPPYNVGYEYEGYSDNLPYHEYLSRLADVFYECKRVLKPTGSIVVVQGDEYAAETKLQLDKLFTLRNWCIWNYTFGVACQGKFSRSHVHVFYYVVDPHCHTWNGDAVRVPSKRQTEYNDPRANPAGEPRGRTPRANPAGKIPDDVMTFSRVCGTFKERVDFPCQMPLALVERFVLALSNPGDTVLDPYCGSGTTLVAAKKNGRNSIGIDVSEKAISIAKERLQ